MYFFFFFFFLISLVFMCFSAVVIGVYVVMFLLLCIDNEANYLYSLVLCCFGAFVF